MPSIWIRALFVLAITSRASAQTVPTIGLYADPGGTDCNVVTALGTPVKAYVVLVPRISPATLTEASIWVQLEYSSVVVSDVVPTALATWAFGNPFTSSGAILQVQLCPTATPVVLYTATLTRTAAPAWEIRVETTAKWTPCTPGTFATRSLTTIDNPEIPSPPASPTPEDGATIVRACITGGHQTLTWSGRIESTTCRHNYWRVYFGTSSNPPLIGANSSFPGYDAGRLSYNTTYYWRVETVVVNFGIPTDTILRGPLWNVLAQVDTDGSGSRFPMAIVEGSQLQDVRVSVKCKPVSGKVDQACGLVFRYRDANNYYVTRANALEGNIRLYFVRDGKRKQIGSFKAPVTASAWHDYRVEAKGSRISVYWDGKQVLSVDDDTFPGAGKIGLWTKADSVSYFDDLVVTPL